MYKMSSATSLDNFLASKAGKFKPSQLERYKEKNAPKNIQTIIGIGGGPKMGIIMEEYARFQWPILQTRNKGKTETGYDHVIKLHDQTLYIEQKSSGHWGNDDYKWQHVESKHKWNMLLLCGIDYTEVKFWAMDRKTFHQLISDKKITNQGNKSGDSSEGMWFNYSAVKDSLVEIRSQEELLQFVSSLQASSE
jgi:hypothetical protein